LHAFWNVRNKGSKTVRFVTDSLSKPAAYYLRPGSRQVADAGLGFSASQNGQSIFG
jgi:hypothetical protein